MKYLKQDQPELAWILDVECDGLNPTVIWCVVVKNLKTEEVLSFRTKEEFTAWYNPTYILIGHNLISFDVPVINRLYNLGIDLGNCIDTLVLSYLYKPALEEGHSLEAWGQRLKFPKGQFSDWSKYSEEMLLYCIQDVNLTHKVYNALGKKLLQYGYSELSCSIEHQIRIIIDDQTRYGAWFNLSRALGFRDFLKQTQCELAEQVQNLFPPELKPVARYTFRRLKDGSPTASYGRHLQKYNSLTHVIEDGVEYYDCYELTAFNLGSSKQRIQKLLELGWEPVDFTPKGSPKVDEDALLKYATLSGRQEIKALAEWLVLQGRITMLTGNPFRKPKPSKGWLDYVKDHGEGNTRIHGSVFSCGAASRRMTHNSPNTANVPSAKKAKYGKEFRSFWGVQPNKGLCLVGYDAKGLETECLKHWLNSSAANKILDGDIHTENAKDLSNFLQRPVDREWGAKTSWYAWMFGCYPPKLAMILKCTVKEAEKIIDEIYLNRIPGLRGLIDAVQSEWRTSGGRLQTVDGGYVWCPMLSAALNYKIQPTGAVVMKLSSIIVKEEAMRQGIWNRKILDVHDEGQHETEEKLIYFKKEKNKHGEDVEVKKHPFGDIAVEAIKEAGRRLKLNVPLDGSYAVGSNWSETH